MKVFVSGGTGYIGQRLIQLLLDRGHTVTALARAGAASRVPTGARTVTGNALEALTFSAKIPDVDTFIHLVGVSHPAPWKEREFREVDLASVKASVSAVKDRGIRNFVYVSVARPAPVMKAYIQIRAECEAIVAATGLNVNILRPWYVLGPGHRWPVVLIPFYKLFEKVPGASETARRLGLVTIQEMVRALAWAAENPAVGQRIISVPEIRRLASLLLQDRDGGAATPATAAR